MATQVSLNSGAVASAGTLALQTNGTTEAVSISTGQVATLAQNPILTSGTANGVAYLNGSKAVTSGSALTFDGTNFATTGTASATKMIPTGGSATGNGMYLPASNTLAWSNNGSETMRLDSAGNLGLGVTPSAWTAGRTALQIYGSSTAVYFAGATTNTVFANNYYYNAGDKFVTASGYAQNYQQQSGGSHVWLTSSATSGGAGATATMNTLMTLDASGNLGVGTTSPATKFHVSGSGSVIGQIETSSTQYALLRLKNSVHSSDVGADSTSLYMDSGGAYPIVFYTGATSTERARIDSSGNLLVGATSNVTNAARLLVQTASDYQLTLNASTSSGSVYSAMNFTQTGTVKGAIYQDHANTRLTIQCNGSGGVYLASGATSWTANSDERLKDIIEPITDATNKVSSLRAVIGKYKTDEEGTRRSFLIAQDVQSVLPEAVTSGTLSRSEDTTEYLGVAYTEVIPLLVAAIKEQNQLIQSLTERISALEGAKA